jgi:CRP/FNR family cyclic AMP-dependent transcriptional regulator
LATFRWPSNIGAASATPIAASSGPIPKAPGSAGGYLLIPGEIFGEIAFLDGGERTADAVAIENSELMVIERRDFITLMRTHPEIATRLLAILCRRLRKTTIQVEDIVFFSVQIRLAKALLYLYRRNLPGTPEADIRITQRDLSQMIGASRETTNRELQLWQKRKWLKLKRAGLNILKPNELERLVEEGSE